MAKGRHEKEQIAWVPRELGQGEEGHEQVHGRERPRARTGGRGARGPGGASRSREGPEHERGGGEAHARSSVSRSGSVAGVVAEERRKLIGQEAEGAGPETRRLASAFGRARQEVLERPPVVGGVPEQAGQIAERHPEGQHGRGTERGSRGREQKHEAESREVDDREDVAPEGEPEKDARAEGQGRPRFGRLQPTHGEDEGQGSEGQHLDVVPVVAETVARDVGRREREIETRAHAPPRAQLRSLARRAGPARRRRPTNSR